MRQWRFAATDYEIIEHYTSSYAKWQPFTKPRCQLYREKIRESENLFIQWTPAVYPQPKKKKKSIRLSE